MRHLIDGYNLLHAIGLGTPRRSRAEWDQARRRLLDWIADQHGENASSVTVALDAQNEAGRKRHIESHRGLRVVRNAGMSADDLIDQLLRDDADPGELTVVSDDRGVQSAARVSGARFVGCVAYVDSLMRPAKPPAAPRPPEKPDAASAEETAELLRAFG